MPVLTDARNENRAEVIDALSISPRPPVRLRLATVRDVRREAARLYTEARNGQLEPHVATRLAYLLQTIAGLIRDGEIEARLSALETQLKEARR